MAEVGIDVQSLYSAHAWHRERPLSTVSTNALKPDLMDAIARLRENITSVFYGNPAAVERVIRCLLARGHVLIEDVPGVGKTVLATAMAKSINCQFTRIQLTPDMLPSDVLGVSVYNTQTGEFVFKKGPIFSNIILADEINRTTPRTQTALLEAMNEATVSIDGSSFRLEQPFMVIATQNPYEYEGTYLLPENQLDRFLMRTRLGYPSPEVEAKVLERRPADSTLPGLEPVMSRRFRGWRSKLKNRLMGASNGGAASTSRWRMSSRLS